MVEHAEPLSLVLWTIVAFAASLYPLGFMLGGSCSTCCTTECDEVFEFNRCVRFVNNDQTDPPETLALGADTRGPIHGFSVKVSRPGDVGAKRVATRIIVPFEAFVRGAASSLSDGETRTAVYAFSYQTEAGPQEAVKWTITLHGVTVPLSPPTLESREATTTSSQASTRTYRITETRMNTSAAPTVRVHSCSVVSGGQWLDGNSVTEGDLKAMLTNNIVTTGGIVSVNSVFTLNAPLFRYVPRNLSVILRYVVEHSRGNTRRYGVQEVRVFQTADAQAIPEEGLSPLIIVPTPYENTPLTRTPTVFAGDTPTTKTATIYTDNLFTSEATTGDMSVPFPDVEIRPTGAQLQRQENGLPLVYVQENEFIVINNLPPSYGVDKRRWILAPHFGVAPYANTAAEGAIFRKNNSWIYDYDLVESFLNGETTLPYETTNHGTFTMQVSPQARYCGDPLSTRYGLTSTQDISHVTPADTIERVVTCKLSPPPASAQWNGDVEDMPMKLGYRTTFFNGTDYYGMQYQCAGFNGINSLTRQISMRAFYCGDLLWVLENGPCRTTVTKPSASGWGPDEFTLGGDYTLPSLFGTSCPGSAFGYSDTVRELTAPKEGGVISVGMPAGGTTIFRYYQVPQNDSRDSVLYHVPVDGYTYITQAGHGNQCNFYIKWLSNTSNIGSVNSSGAAFLSEKCPILGQIDHAVSGIYGLAYYQPGCDWSVTSSASWLIAERVEEGLEEGLLKLSIDNTVEAVFTERFNTQRSAIITVISGETTKTWTIEHRRL
jgi:hypothetical protein